MQRLEARINAVSGGSTPPGTIVTADCATSADGGQHHAHQRALFSIGEAMGVTSFTGFGATGGALAARTPLESLRA